MRLKLFLYVGLPLIITLITLISVKYYQLTSTITKLEAQAEQLKNQKVVLEVDLQTEKDNVTVLKNVVNEQNSEIEKMAIKNQNTIKAFNDFKKKTEKEKYENQKVLDLMTNKLWNSQTCDDGLKLNKMISELNYDDL